MSQNENNQPVVLTIAGLDPSGGAGVIADIRTFAALGCFPTAAISSLTFQNEFQVFGAEHLSAETLRAQVLPIVSAHTVAGAKTGMLPTSEIVRETARLFREANLPAPIVDPVMRSTSGYPLIEAGAIEALLSELLPLARLITPNIPEAERITGLRITDEAGMRQAAREIRELGARAVLIKGGHLRSQDSGVVGQESSESLGPRASRPHSSPEEIALIDRAIVGEPRSLPQSKQQAGGTSTPSGLPRWGPRLPAVPVRESIDLLDDDGTVTIFRGAWIDVGNVRGTGCMLSAAIAAGLAKGMSLAKSVGEAKRFVSESIAKL